MELPADRTSVMTRIHAATRTVPDGIVSHRAAGFLHGLPITAPDVIDLIVPRRRRARPGLRTHELAVSDLEVVEIDDLQVTSLVRTVSDGLGVLAADEWWGLLAWVVTREAVSHGDLADQVSRRLGGAGNAGRRRALPYLTARAASRAELRLHQVLRRFGIDGWQANAPVRLAGRIVAVADVLFPTQRVIVEVDGRDFHGVERREADARRDATLRAAGHVVIRLTAAQVVGDPWATADVVRSALARAA
jgi:very-short-patch-repair endonuclease